MDPDQTQLRSKTFLIRPKCARRGYDQTQLRSKSPLIRQKCARRGYDQTQLHSKSALIRPKCARIRLWSDFLDQIDQWSDHFQTIVQTVVRLNFLSDPLNSVWEHTGVRSTGSDHKPIWVWTSTWGFFKLARFAIFFSQRFTTSSFWLLLISFETFVSCLTVEAVLSSNFSMRFKQKSSCGLKISPVSRLMGLLHRS